MILPFVNRLLICCLSCSLCQATYTDLLAFLNYKRSQGSAFGTGSGTNQLPYQIRISYECFKVYWNVPSQVCATKQGINLTLSPFGIRANKDQNFFGDQINILYDRDGLLWPHIENSGKLVNGGIPQRGNLRDHLRSFEVQVGKKIPSPAFSGLAIIDFELYPPLWSSLWGQSNIYKNLSLEYAKSYLGMPDAPLDDPDVLKYAINSFEAASRVFMEQTLLFGRTLRPYAKWGYYGFPTCSKTQFLMDGCPLSEQNKNEQLMWLYLASDALFPSIYLYKAAFDSEAQYPLWILKMFREIARLTQIINTRRRLAMKPLIEVYPYFRYEYASNEESNTQFLSDKDMKTSILGAKAFNFNGLIIWDSSNKIVNQCALISNLVQKYLGPLVYYASRCYI